MQGERSSKNKIMYRKNLCARLPTNPLFATTPHLIRARALPSPHATLIQRIYRMPCGVSDRNTSNEFINLYSNLKTYGMKRLFLSLAIGLAIAASPQPLSAQRKPANLPLKSGKTVLTPEQQRAYADLRKSSPTLFILKPCTPLQVSPYQVKPYTVRQQPPLRKATVNPNLVMWGDVISATVPGFHSFSPTSPVTVNRLNEYTQGYFNAGCGRVGNKLCFLCSRTRNLPKIFQCFILFNTL